MPLNAESCLTTDANFDVQLQLAPPWSVIRVIKLRYVLLALHELYHHIHQLLKFEKVNKLWHNKPWRNNVSPPRAVTRFVGYATATRRRYEASVARHKNNKSATWFYVREFRSGILLLILMPRDSFRLLTILTLIQIPLLISLEYWKYNNIR